MHDRTKKWLKAGVISLGIAVFIRYFIFIPVKVEGNSMRPALQPGDHVLYETFTSVDRFDIILFHDSQGEAYIKRVIGLPGEEISYHNDQLYVEGEPLVEPFLLSKKKEDNQLFTPDFTLEDLTGSDTIPEDAYFVLGDNRIRSKDSRIFGFVPKSSVEGKARIIIYPFTKISFLLSK